MLLLLTHVILFMLKIGISLGIEGKYTRNFEKYQLVFPKRVYSDGIHTGGNDHGSRQLRSNIDEGFSLQYKLHLDGTDETLDLKPNRRLISPAALVEVRSRDKGNFDLLSDIKLKPLHEKPCIFSGKVMNYEDSSSAISICNGLSGFIKIKRQTFYIEPVNGSNSNELSKQAHVLYTPKVDEFKEVNCGTVNKCIQKKGKVREQIHEASKVSPGGNLTKGTLNNSLNIEATIVMDRAMMEKHPRNDLEGYVLTVLNIASSLLKKLSEDFPINLEMVRLVYLEDPEDEINQKKKRKASEWLKIFSKWQNLNNPKNDSHPNHHDVALLFTGNDICKDKDDCGLIGVAEENGICQPERQASVCKDNGLALGETVAHEIAHTLGISHDLRDGAVNGTEPSGNAFVMSPWISLRSASWSPQSKKALQASIEGGNLNCLNDEVILNNINQNEFLPGELYGVDFQCKRLYDEEVMGCDLKENCQSLRCQYEGTACSNTGIVPASGTPCGSNKWCFNGECIEAGRHPKAVNGQWSAWSGWSSCTRSCGMGISEATRECNNPTPKHGGKTCKGKAKRYKICSTKMCPINSSSFRDVQCASFNDFSGDGKKHKWTALYSPNGNPCALVCKNEEDVQALLSPSVIDGTRCNKGIRDICIEGVCQTLPCDLKFNSDSVEDACGICHGDGASCEIQQGIKSMPKGTSKCLAKVPQGTRNIKVEVKNPSNSHFIVKREDGDAPLNKGRKLGLFKVPGSVAWLGMIKPNQEFLNIPGPIKEPLTIWISSSDPQVVSYTMGLPGIPRNGTYSWQFIDWLPCKAQCGEAVQISEPKCVESLSGLVENKYCKKLKKPDVKKRACNAGPCFPRWQIGEWQECGPCPSDKAKRFRHIQCIRPIPGTEEGSEIIHNMECPGNPPKFSKNCPCIKRQAGYWPPVYQPTSFGFTNIFLKKDRDLKQKKIPEKKITLMQLEDESQASMLKQFRENQSKQPPFYYVPTFFGGKFNFSFPHRKKRTVWANVSNAALIESQVPISSSNENQALSENIESSAQNLIENQNNLSPESKEIIYGPLNIFHTDVPGNYKPVLYNNQGRESLTSSLTSTQTPLNFSENIFKIISQNIPITNLQKQNETVRKDRIQNAEMQYSNDLLIDPNDSARLMALYKTLQMQSYLQSLTQSPLDDSIRDLNSKIELKKSEENFCDSNYRDSARIPPPNINLFMKKNKASGLQEKNNYVTSVNQNTSSNNLLDNRIKTDMTRFKTYNGPPWLNDFNEKIKESNSHGSIKQLHKDVIDFPADFGVVNRNKQSKNQLDLATSKEGINFDKFLVQRINDDLHHLSYVDKLRIYDDLHNISNTLYNLLFFSNTVEITSKRVQSSMETGSDYNQTNINLMQDGKFFGKYNRIIPSLKNNSRIINKQTNNTFSGRGKQVQNYSTNYITGDFMKILNPKDQKLLSENTCEYFQDIQKQNVISNPTVNTTSSKIKMVSPKDNVSLKNVYGSKTQNYPLKVHDINRNSNETFQTYKLVPAKDLENEQNLLYGDQLSYLRALPESKSISNYEILNKEIPILNEYSNISLNSKQIKRNTIKTYLKSYPLNQLANTPFEIPINMRKRDLPFKSTFPKILLHVIN